MLNDELEFLLLFNIHMIVINFINYELLSQFVLMNCLHILFNLQAY